MGVILVIKGDIQELKTIFRYANLTNCVLIYFHLKGAVFLLYRGGHYVYLQTDCIVKRHTALPIISCTNIERFINAQERRALREGCELRTISIGQEQIIVTATVQVSHTYSIPMFQDVFFSPTAERLQYMITYENPKAPTIRLKKRILMDFLKRSAIDSRTAISFSVKENILHIERLKFDGSVKKAVTYNDGFIPVSGAKRSVFLLNDDALYLLRGNRFIRPDDYVHLSITKDYIQLTYDRTPGKFRFFLPFKTDTQIEKVL